jgi:hypothetical protein
VSALRTAPNERLDLTLCCGAPFAAGKCTTPAASKKNSRKRSPACEEARSRPSGAGRAPGSEGFVSFFALRSEPLNVQPEEEPLTEATGAGLRWIFTGLGEDPTQVRATSGGSVRNVALGVTGTLVALGAGQNPGEGTCEQYWVVDEVEVPDSTPHAQRRVRGGTGDLQLRLASGSTVWCTSHHCRPWQRSDGDAVDPSASLAKSRPSSPAPPLEPEHSPLPPADEEAAAPAPPPTRHSPLPTSQSTPPTVPEEPQRTDQDSPKEGATFCAPSH